VAKIVMVHGISNQFAGEMELRAAWHPALCDGLLRAGSPRLPAPDDCVCPFYGDLFRRTAHLGAGIASDDVVDVTTEEAAVLEAVWEAAAASDPAVPAPAEYTDTLARAPRVVERALNALTRSRFLANAVPLQFFGDLKQVVSYLNDASVHERVLERVVSKIDADTRVVIGHSLGSVIAYEALCQRPGNVTTFVTMGSPLGMANVVFHKLTPAPVDGRGQWPGAVDAWTNVAAVGDIVAARKALAPLFGSRVEDVLIDSGWEAHWVLRYLNTRETGVAVARALA
jgi:hypothetical protein